MKEQVEARPKRVELLLRFVESVGHTPAGGHLGIFLGGYVPPGTPNWHPILKKLSPKIDTPF